MLFIFAGLGGLTSVFVTAIPSVGLQSASDIIKQAAFIMPNYAAAQVCFDE